jgi:hypothetical protein
MYDWHENIKIDVFKEGFLVDSTQFHNIITDVGLTWLADSLRSTHCNKIYYLGWGASSAAASTSNTALSTETGRKLVTSQTSSGVGVCITTVYLGPTEAVGSIKELGWFAGTSASATALSGTMLSRVIYERNKTALESITVTRTDTLIRTTS